MFEHQISRRWSLVRRLLVFSYTNSLSEYDRGLNLLDAPDMANHLFIGRDDELQRIETVLLSDLDSSDRKVLVLGGMGGIGKTQLAVRYAKKHHTSYTSVFWINAISESRLRTSLRRLAPQILLRVTGKGLDDDELWAQISLWLSEQENSRWLLIFDNYDEPDQYKIEKYYPSVAHGTIIITTRQLDRVNGYPVKVQSIARYEDSLNILATWSGRPDALLGNHSTLITI
jgi:NB-ARC domain